MEVLLDTNFIISCVRKNIPFIEQLEKEGFKVLLPKEVFQELKDLKKNAKQEDRVAIDLALEIFERNDTKRVSVGKDKVDLGLIKMGKQGAYIATLDNEIKRNIPNRVVINSAGKKIEVQRD